MKVTVTFENFDNDIDQQNNFVLKILNPDEFLEFTMRNDRVEFFTSRSIDEIYKAMDEVGYSPDDFRSIEYE